MAAFQKSRSKFFKFFSALMAAAFLLAGAASVAAETWIADPAIDYITSINNNGWAAMTASDENDVEILLNNGLGTIRLTDNNTHDSMPVINEKGWVAWQGLRKDQYDIFLYDGEKIGQLTKPGKGGTSPALSNNGHVVWLEDPWDPGLAIYKDGKIKYLRGQLNYNTPDVNDNGWVTWLGMKTQKPDEVFLWNGEKTIQLTDNMSNDWAPRINNQGWVTWFGGVTANNTFNYEIFLYNGIKKIQVTDRFKDNLLANADPLINERGMLVWRASPLVDGLETGPFLYMYDGGQIKQIPNSFAPQSYQINDKGWVAWSGSDGFQDREIFVYDGNETIQVTDNDYDDLYPAINNISWDGLLFKAGTTATASGTGSRMLSVASVGDKAKPKVSVAAPFVSTKVSATTAFKVSWQAYDPAAMVWQTKVGTQMKLRRAGLSGIRSYSVDFRRAKSSTWSRLKTNTTAKDTLLTGSPGVTYYFRTMARDNAGNEGKSTVRRTVVPYDQGANIFKRIGFNKFAAARRYYLGSVWYSKRRGDTMAYKLNNTNGVGLVTSKASDRGRAKIYVDGKYVKTIDAYSSKFRPRQKVFYKSFSKKGVHYIKIVNEGTPGRPRFDVDGVIAAR